MKKFLLLASLLFAAFGAKAETKDLGHVIVSQNQAWQYDGYTAGIDETDMGFGVKLPKTMISNFAGCKIIGFRIGWGAPQFPGELNVFLREGSFNAPDLTTQQATVYSNNTTTMYWNEVKLDTPYEITYNTEDLYMGYYVSFPAQTPTASMSPLGQRPAGSLYFSFPDELDNNGDRIWYDALQNSAYSALLMVAIVEIPEGLEKTAAAEITTLFTPGIQRVGDMKTAYMKIRNHGTEDISSIKFRYSIGDQSYEHTQVLTGGTIPAGEQKTIYAPVAALATGNTRLEITELNNKPNNFKQDLTYPILAVPADVADNYHHRPVTEFFASETTHLQPLYFDSIFMVGFKPHINDISLICHHISDQFMTGDDDDSALGLMLSDNNPNVGIPSVMFDRSVVPTDPQGPSSISVINSILYPEFAEYPYKETLERPTFVSVNVETALNTASDELTITVSGNIEPNILPADEQLYISVYLVEDYVESTAQDWADETQKEAYGGVIKHMAVIRQRPTSVFGDVLGAQGEYSKTYTVDIDPELWKINDMRAIALVHRDYRNERFERQVINAGERSADSASIRAIEADGTEAIISVANGTVTLNGSTAGVKVYNLAGIEMPNSGLRTGIYVVKAGTIQTKVIVK
ncbi:MAG: Omp28-related outer membrane protein [Bacteroidales bacterium]|nr:Omp28-related outer membrane protein [Bacteroidales bacterium]